MNIAQTKVDCLMKEQLVQLLTATWDGDLISKLMRTDLVNQGLAVKGGNGFNIITPAGLDWLAKEGIISP